MNVLTCHQVTKQFKSVTAVDDVSFEVKQGEIFGLIGPNGAGKTTLLNCCEGLDTPTSGSIRVLDLDPRNDLTQLTKRVGVQLQSAALPPKLTVGEALAMYASMYNKTLPIDELLDLLGILEKKNTLVDKLSGGQRQRVFIALALIHEPELVFLDELTTALDPQARLAMWDVVASIRKRGSTVVMTTHYMEEAEHLCDRVGIIDHGKLIALDTVPNLIQAYAPQSTTTLQVQPSPSPDWVFDVKNRTDAEVTVDQDSITITDQRAVQTIMGHLAEAGITVTGVTTNTPGLEEVFLALTGREMRKENAS